MGAHALVDPRTSIREGHGKSIEDRGNDAENRAKYFVHEYSPVALYLDDCFLMKKKSKKKRGGSRGRVRPRIRSKVKVR